MQMWKARPLADSLHGSRDQSTTSSQISKVINLTQFNFKSTLDCLSLGK